MRIPLEIENMVINLTIGGHIEQEVRDIETHLSSLPETRYYLRTTGIFKLCPPNEVREEEPVWTFTLRDTDHLLPIFNEYVRQLSPVLANLQ